jgi:chitinase
MRTTHQITRCLILNLMIGIFLLNGCATPAAPSPTPTLISTATSAPTATPVPTPFRIIAYVTDAVIPQVIPYDRLTHINYFSAIPNVDGTLQPMLNDWKISQIIASAHSQGIRVLICLGGGGNPSSAFETVASTTELRTKLIQSVIKLVNDFQFDGVDMDWEFPVAGKSDQDYTALMTELRGALPQGKLLTAAVSAYGKNGDVISANVFEIVDFLNVMIYDGPDHGTLDQFEKSIAYWQGRGLPPEKTVLGVPFYSHPDGLPTANGYTYAKLVAADPSAAQSDSFDYYGATQIYNGIPTIQTKTRLAIEKANGIMFWTLEMDAPGDLSLVKAIYDTSKEGK